MKFLSTKLWQSYLSAVFSGGAGGARAPPKFRGSQKGQSLISTYQSLAITTNTPGFEKLNTALPGGIGGLGGIQVQNLGGNVPVENHTGSLRQTNNQGLERNELKICIKTTTFL